MPQNSLGYNGMPNTAAAQSSYYQQSVYAGSANPDLAKAPQSIQETNQQQYNYNGYYEQALFDEHGYPQNTTPSVPNDRQQTNHQSHPSYSHDIDILAGVALGLEANAADHPTSFNNQTSKIHDSPEHLWAQFLESEHDSGIPWEPPQIGPEVLNGPQQANTVTYPQSIGGYAAQANTQYDSVYGDQYGHHQQQAQQQQQSQSQPFNTASSQPSTQGPGPSSNYGYAQRQQSLYQQSQYGYERSSQQPPVRPNSRLQSQEQNIRPAGPVLRNSSTDIVYQAQTQDNRASQPRSLQRTESAQYSIINNSVSPSVETQPSSQPGINIVPNSITSQIKRQSSANLTNSSTVPQDQWKRSRVLDGVSTPGTTATTLASTPLFPNRNQSNTSTSPTLQALHIQRPSYEDHSHAKMPGSVDFGGMKVQGQRQLPQHTQPIQRQAQTPLNRLPSITSFTSSVQIPSVVKQEWATLPPFDSPNHANIDKSELRSSILNGQDRDSIMATLLAESDYVDPPMTRSEYLATLGDMPEIITTVPYNRLDYYARSSIPADMPPEVYAKEGIESAIASRLPPFALHTLEYALLKNDINHLHVTTYLNIRNGVLRLWRMNHHVSVTRPEAAGCARDSRFFGLAEAAFEFLVRYGYINFGVLDVPRCRNNFPYTLPISEVRKPRLRIVIIGAGISGLGCGRQLDGLFKQYDDFLSGYEAAPEIVIVEGRKRIGGRVYSAPLKQEGNNLHKVDLGGQIITGFGNGNPMSVIVRKQLGLKCHELQDAGLLYDVVTGSPVSASLDRRAEGLFNDMLDRISVYRKPSIPQHTVEGDVSLIMSGKDPTGDGGRTIARMEANSVVLPPIAGSDKSPKMFARADVMKPPEVALDVKLEELGYVVSRHIDTEHTAWPTPSEAPTLGGTLDEQLNIVRKLADLSAQDLRLLNWHYANLEYANATSVHNLSLGSWDQDDGNEFSGRHTIVADGGYMQVARALYLYPTLLDVRLNSAVTDVIYDATKEEGRKKFTVSLSTGERIPADCVISTVPLGVLKANSINFQPQLPEDKQKSIKNLGFGVLNKIVLVYDSCFWDLDREIIGVARDNDHGDPLKQESYKDVRGRFYMFWNCTKAVGKYCLVGLMAGNAAFDTSKHSDDALIRDATYVLSRMYPAAPIPHPVESIITKWHLDPFSLGSYSYIGTEATGADYDTLARPACDSNLIFAGEATSRTHPATVHGAYLSGLRAAEEAFRNIVGEITLASPLVRPKPRSNAPMQKETVKFPPPPRSAYVGDRAPVPQPVVVPPPAAAAFEDDDDVQPIIKKRGKPGPKPRPKSVAPSVPTGQAGSSQNVVQGVASLQYPIAQTTFHQHTYSQALPGQTHETQGVVNIGINGMMN